MIITNCLNFCNEWRLHFFIPRMDTRLSLDFYLLFFRQWIINFQLLSLDVCTNSMCFRPCSSLWTSIVQQKSIDILSVYFFLLAVQLGWCREWIMGMVHKKNAYMSSYIFDYSNIFVLACAATSHSLQFYLFHFNWNVQANQMKIYYYATILAAHDTLHWYNNWKYMLTFSGISDAIITRECQNSCHIHRPSTKHKLCKHKNAFSFFLNPMQISSNFLQISWCC